MTDRIVVKRETYYDSVALMQLSREALDLPGVDEAAIVSGTPLNQGLVRQQGFALPVALSPDDTLIAVRARSREYAEAAVRAIEERLAARGVGMDPASSAEDQPRTVRSAVRRDTALNLAFISVPDRYAAYEVSSALGAGLNVFCFSSGIDLEDEVALKQQAAARGLLLMGPDCGTALIDGVGYGFANVVDRGPVGIVGASGTGIQNLACLLDAAGVGISHAIGVGSRDLTDEVGGIMTRTALGLLARDPLTEIILVISKPPGRLVRDQVPAWVAKTGKKGVVAFLGVAPEDAHRPQGVEVLIGLEEAGARVAQLAGGHWPEPESLVVRAAPGHIRGLFCGGSLCYEAMSVVAAAVGPVASNTPLRSDWALSDLAAADGDAFIDFGHEDLTRGRPHPIIDPTLRNARFRQEAADPRITAIVLDVLLGFGAHRDPAQELLPVVEQAGRERPNDLTVVVSLCGTAGDPQGYEDQRRRLEEAGALVTGSAARAARLALRAAARGAS